MKQKKNDKKKRQRKADTKPKDPCSTCNWRIPARPCLWPAGICGLASAKPADPKNLHTTPKGAMPHEHPTL